MSSPIQIVFRPRFRLQQVAPIRMDEARERAEEAVAHWQALFPGPSDRSADYEDWHENAAALLAAINTGLPVFVMQRSLGRDPKDWLRVERSFNTSAQEPTPGTPTVLIGSLLERDPLRETQDVLWPLSSSFGAANRYWENPAFERFAARAVEVAAYTSEGDPGHETEATLVPTIARLAKQVGPSLMLKIISKAKYAPVTPFFVRDPGDLSAIEADLMEEFQYTLIHVEGRLPQFLVQERIELEAEYRVLVVDGEPVAGAACIESMCPPWNAGEAFHPAVEACRGSGIVRHDPDLVASYVARAREVASALRAANPDFCDATLDFGLKPDGSIALIETNPCGNFGLYALDYSRFLRAAIEATGERAKALQHAAPSP